MLTRRPVVWSVILELSLLALPCALFAQPSIEVYAGTVSADRPSSRPDVRLFGGVVDVVAMFDDGMFEAMGCRPCAGGSSVRVGARITAEIGTMRVTEQIDALETLAYDPVAYLVVPRLIAATLMLPVLVILADFIGVGTAFITAVVATDVSAAAFSDGLRLAFAPFQIVYSIIKATIFGAAIAFFCTYEGYNTSAGAEGVGRSTAQAVVITSVAILVLDALTALLLAPYLQA